MKKLIMIIGFVAFILTYLGLARAQYSPYGPGGNLSMGPRGGLSMGPGGGLSMGPWGGLSMGPGGGLSMGPGGGLSMGPGGGLSMGPGGGLSMGPGGGLSMGPGGGLSMGPGGGLSMGPGGGLSMGPSPWQPVPGYDPLLADFVPPCVRVFGGQWIVSDECGVTHLYGLSEAIRDRRPDRLAYFAFDLLHLDGHDLRRCPIEDRKALLRDLIGAAGCPRIVCV